LRNILISGMNIGCLCMADDRSQTTIYGAPVCSIHGIAWGQCDCVGISASSMQLYLVPKELSPEMLHAARCCIRASEANIRQAWSLMLIEAWLKYGKPARAKAI
jgi:hypothetical protein